MKIIKAKTAGFCFGVDRAVKLTYGLLEQGVRVATLGPLIHNPQCVADLAARGAVIVDTPEQVPDGYEVVVRSHGVPQCVYDALGARGLVVHDATCPFVAKIHRLARRAGEEGKTLLVAGDKNHPEVQGIVGHTRGSVFVFADLEELKALLTMNSNDLIESMTFVPSVTETVQSSSISDKTASIALNYQQVYQTQVHETVQQILVQLNESKLQVERLEFYISTLAPEISEILRQHYFDELTWEEIANRNCSCLRTIKNRRERGIEYLAKLYEKLADMGRLPEISIP